MVDLNPWIGLVEAHALLFGAVFLVAGFVLGLLNRAAAYVVLAVSVFTAGSVIFGQLGKQQSLTATGIAIVIAVVSATALFRVARYLLLALEFVVFFVAWFLLLYSAYGFAFTQDVLLVALWLVAGFACLFLSRSASALLFRTNPAWKAAAPVARK
ncbi:MAG TPA: hypothetical protein VIB49_01390 [Thermoplasmata archaeon]|jgi:hypothetical protein